MAAEVVGPIGRRLPRQDKYSGLPRRVAATTAGYAASSSPGEIEYIPVLPPVNITRKLPSGLPKEHWVFRAHQSASVPPAFVARLPKGRAVGYYGATITNDNAFLFDLSPYFGAVRPTQHPMFLRLKLPSVREVTGVAGLLTTRGIDNYYHFLLDVIPRLDLLRRSGLDADTYVVNQALGFQDELLRAFDVPADRVLESTVNPHVRADVLVVPSLPDNEMRTPGWIVSLLRDRLLPTDLKSPYRRLYIGRGIRRNTRRVENEQALLATLSEYGVTPVDPGSMSVKEQIRLFAEAELVIGAHGAALTNLVFCSSGARIIELFPPDYVNVCFWALSCQVPGLNYRYLIGDGRPHRLGRPMLGISSDFAVDPASVRQLLDAAL